MIYCPGMNPKLCFPWDPEQTQQTNSLYRDKPTEWHSTGPNTERCGVTILNLIQLNWNLPGFYNASKITSDAIVLSGYLLYHQYS